MIFRDTVSIKETEGQIDFEEDAGSINEIENQVDFEVNEGSTDDIESQADTNFESQFAALVTLQEGVRMEQSQLTDKTPQPEPPKPTNAKDSRCTTTTTGF